MGSKSSRPASVIPLPPPTTTNTSPTPVTTTAVSLNAQLQSLQAAVFGLALVSTCHEDVDESSTDYKSMDDRVLPKPTGDDLLALWNPPHIMLTDKQAAIVRYILNQLSTGPDQDRFLNRVSLLLELGLQAEKQGQAAVEKLRNGLAAMEVAADGIDYVAEVRDAQNRQSLQNYLREELKFTQAQVPKDWTTQALLSMTLDEWRSVLLTDDPIPSEARLEIAQKAYDYVQLNMKEPDVSKTDTSEVD